MPNFTPFYFLKLGVTFNVENFLKYKLGINAPLAYVIYHNYFSLFIVQKVHGRSSW
jgi:hypothetical protein